MIGSNTFDAFFRSFIYSKNGSGPSIERYGTPHVTVSSSVRKKKRSAQFFILKVTKKLNNKNAKICVLEDLELKIFFAS